ncbi:spinster family MFS transporter [Acidocella sp.]|uniref:spinster family MFS transporter n=1 Tax=Acidocella sp. TaxID=50710 RepID=UPI003CFE0BD9
MSEIGIGKVAPIAVPAPFGAVKRWAIVCLFILAYILSYTDRQLLSLLVGPVRQTFHITDTEFGLLNGLAFALFYAVLGIPVAKMSDRLPRPSVMAAGVLIWSLATMACGIVSSFAELFIARIIVGAGEASLAPAVYSYIADIFPREKLGRALGIFSLGPFLGTGVAFLLGGIAIAYVTHLGPLSLFGMPLAPWQLCFVLIGIPGLVVALLIVSLVREVAERGAKAAKPAPSLAEVLAFLWREKAIFFPHMLGFTLLAMTLFTLMSWSPAALERLFHLTPHQVGPVLGMIIFLCGSAGVLCSGFLVDMFYSRGKKAAPIIVGVIGGLCSVVPAALIGFVSSQEMMIVVLVVAFFFASFPLPTSVSVMQIVPPADMRSRVSAIFLFCNSLGGLALGAFLVGFLNDHVFHSDMAVGTSLAVVTALSALLGGLLLTRCHGPYLRYLNNKG